MRKFKIGKQTLTPWNLLIAIVEGNEKDIMGIDPAIDEFIEFQYARAKFLSIDNLIYACSLVLRKAEANDLLCDIIG